MRRILTTPGYRPPRARFAGALAAEAAWSGYLAENIDQLLLDQSACSISPSARKTDPPGDGHGCRQGRVLELEAEQIQTIDQQGMTATTEVGKAGCYVEGQSSAAKDLGWRFFCLHAQAVGSSCIRICRGTGQLL